jgi:hypothetical protein
MKYKLGKCDGCGTEHYIGMTTYAGILIETCPYVPSNSWGYWYTKTSDSDEDRALPTTDRDPA